jgi:hypothetical protein
VEGSAAITLCARDLHDWLASPAPVLRTDIALAAIRLCRPLKIGLDTAEEHAIAHRQLNSYLDGLAVTTNSSSA